MPDQSPESITLWEGQLTTSAVKLYTAPPGLVVTVDSVTLTNMLASPAAATARLDHVPAGGSDGTTLEIFNESIAESVTIELPATGVGPVAVLQPGDMIYGIAGTATAIDVSIIGTESPIE